jgi:hypothetical protein
VIRNVGFEVEVVQNRQILILHARVQAKQVVSAVPTSTGGSDSSVYTESHGSLRLKADIRNAFNTVIGLLPRTGEGLPLQWSDDDDGDILQLLLTMMTYAYDELDDYDDMMLMVMHVWMMTRVSITIMMIITCGLIDADCLHTT